jgi:hypothetical protein
MKSCFLLKGQHHEQQQRRALQHRPGRCHQPGLSSLQQSSLHVRRKLPGPASRRWRWVRKDRNTYPHCFRRNKEKKITILAARAKISHQKIQYCHEFYAISLLSAKFAIRKNEIFFSFSPLGGGGGGSTAVGDVTFSSYNSINANNNTNNSTYATAADGSTLLSRIDESAASSSAAAAAAAMAGGQMNLCSTVTSAGGGGGGGLSTSSHQVCTLGF